MHQKALGGGEARKPNLKEHALTSSLFTFVLNMILTTSIKCPTNSWHRTKDNPTQMS